MRSFGRDFDLRSVGAAAALLLIAGSGAMADGGPRPYLVGATDLQGEPDWTGFYIGGRLGGAWSDINWTQDLSVFSAAGAVPPGTEVSFGPSGVAGGVFGGGNLQVGHWVFGAELTYSGVDLSESITSPFFPATDMFTTKIDWIGTIEGRIGYAFNHYLVFGKGGWAGSKASLTLANSATGVTASTDEFVDGWTIGGGIEAFVWDRLVVGVDYSYVRLSLSNSPDCPLCIAGLPLFSGPQSISGDADISSVMVRASYLFFPED
jgi:outer membrane immunogenic protein